MRTVHTLHLDPTDRALILEALGIARDELAHRSQVAKNFAPAELRHAISQEMWRKAEAMENLHKRLSDD